MKLRKARQFNKSPTAYGWLGGGIKKMCHLQASSDSYSQDEREKRKRENWILFNYVSERYNDSNVVACYKILKNGSLYICQNEGMRIDKVDSYQFRVFRDSSLCWLLHLLVRCLC